MKSIFLELIFHLFLLPSFVFHREGRLGNTVFELEEELGWNRNKAHENIRTHGLADLCPPAKREIATGECLLMELGERGGRGCHTESQSRTHHKVADARGEPRHAS
jgi:hypothetical protein